MNQIFDTTMLLHHRVAYGTRLDQDPKGARPPWGRLVVWGIAVGVAISLSGPIVS